MNNNHTIFISSTFKDMHTERDMIHNFVYPELASFFQKYAVNVDFVDLRWVLILLMKTVKNKPWR